MNCKLHTLGPLIISRKYYTGYVIYLATQNTFKQKNTKLIHHSFLDTNYKNTINIKKYTKRTNSILLNQKEIRKKNVKEKLSYASQSEINGKNVSNPNYTKSIKKTENDFNSDETPTTNTSIKRQRSATGLEQSKKLNLGDSHETTQFDGKDFETTEERDDYIVESTGSTTKYTHQEIKEINANVKNKQQLKDTHDEQRVTTKTAEKKALNTEIDRRTKLLVTKNIARNIENTTLNLCVDFKTLRRTVAEEVKREVEARKISSSNPEIIQNAIIKTSNQAGEVETTRHNEDQPHIVQNETQQIVQITNSPLQIVHTNINTTQSTLTIDATPSNLRIHTAYASSDSTRLDSQNDQILTQQMDIELTSINHNNLEANNEQQPELFDHGKSEKIKEHEQGMNNHLNSNINTSKKTNNNLGILNKFLTDKQRHLLEMQHNHHIQRSKLYNDYISKCISYSNDREKTKPKIADTNYENETNKGLSALETVYEQEMARLNKTHIFENNQFKPVQSNFDDTYSTNGSNLATGNQSKYPLTYGNNELCDQENECEALTGELLRLEKTYDMEKYVVRIECPGIGKQKYVMDLDKRNNEVKMRTGVRSIKSNKVFVRQEYQNKVYFMVVELGSREDLIKINQAWPIGSFECSDKVVTFTDMIDIELNVENFDKRIVLRMDDQVTRNLQQNGIISHQRTVRKEKTQDKDEYKNIPMNKLTIKVKNLLHLKQVLKNGVALEWSCENHPVKPRIKKARICLRCCQYDHFTSGCKNNPVCGSCGQSHLTIDCSKQLKNCFWCKSASHSAGDDACIKQYQVNYELNKYLVDFMIGEGLHKTIAEALGVQPAEGVSGNEILIDEDKNIERNDIIREQFLEHWGMAKQNFQQEINNLQNRITANEIYAQQVNNNLLKLDKKVTSTLSEMRTELSKDITNQCTAVSEKVQKQLDEHIASVQANFQQNHEKMSSIETNLSDKLNLILTRLNGTQNQH